MSKLYTEEQVKEMIEKSRETGLTAEYLILATTPIVLLPPLDVEDDVDFICEEEAKKFHNKSKHRDDDMYNQLVYEDKLMIKVGYIKAKEKYKFTEQDIAKAVMFTDNYLIEQQTPIELPTDEEIEIAALPYVQDLAFKCGAKWMRDKIKGGEE
jgi:hypothetical protein